MPSTPSQFAELAELCLYLLVIPFIASIALLPFVASRLYAKDFYRPQVFLFALSIVATSLVAMVGSGSCVVGSQLNHQGICSFSFKERWMLGGYSGRLLDPSGDFVELQLIYGFYFVVATLVALSGLTLIGLQAHRLIRGCKNPSAE